MTRTTAILLPDFATTLQNATWRHICLLLMVSSLTIFSSATRGDINNWVNHAETGVFLLRDGSGEALPATTLNTNVDIEISGPVAHITLTQHFHNQVGEFAEGLYVFPLGEQAAVHAMELSIGQRRIVGEIHEHQVAQKIYQQAKVEGKRSALLEQRRANIFSTSVANIAPGENISVTLSYSEVLDRRGNQFNLRLPLTLTPRYRPSLDKVHPQDLPVDFTGPENLQSETDVPRSSSMSAPMPEISGVFNAALAQRSDRHMARIHIRLNAGVEISQLYSRSHQILTPQSNGVFDITPRELEVPMDRDFMMSWTLSPTSGTQGAVFSQDVAGENYALLMLVPPNQPAKAASLPREAIFIIDTSGSMGGESIRQAKAALQEGLKRLHPGDRFNIIEFNSHYRRLFPQSVSVTPQSVAQAQDFVRRLDANGGTEMLAPLQAALSMPAAENALRQILFITDGAVGNEQAIFAALHGQLGSARLFTVGIGSAPNSYFMRKAAQFGRGSFTYINRLDEVQLQMSALFAMLEKPLMRDIKITLPEGVEVEMYPRRIPDLYADEPLVVAMKFNQRPDWIALEGDGVSPWSTRIALDGASVDDKGIAAIWARQKIEALTDRVSRGEAEENLRPEITEVALRHKLLSRYTSFVAVDKTPVRAEGQELLTEVIGNRLPKGLEWPKTATGVNGLWRLAGALLLVCAALAYRQRRFAHAQV